MTGSGLVNSDIVGESGATITATGNLTLGTSSSFSGFNHAGTLDVANFNITLNSAGFANLGIVTTLSGGTLSAANGISLGLGCNLVGSGTVSGKIAAGLGSTISATGNLVLGNGVSPVGFTSNGELYTSVHSVTLNDSNQAVLGSLTQLGGGANSGTLNATNGFLLSVGRNLTGQGTVNSPNTLAKATTIDGSVHGTGSGLDLTGYIQGTGVYSGLVTFSGTYSPGLSPASVSVENLNLVATSLLTMELGGLVAGTQHDQLNIGGIANLDGTLGVVLLNGFTPSFGQQFDLFNGGLNGTFDSVNLPTLSSGLAWDQSRLYSDGVLSVAAVPEPTAFALAAFGFIGVAILTLRRRQLA